MPICKFPKPDTPAFDRIKKQVEEGVSYHILAQELDMTLKGFKDSLLNHQIKRIPTNFSGTLPPVYKWDKSASLEEHIDIMEKMDNLVAFHQRVPSEITIRVETDRPILRVLTADWQLGAFGFDYQAFKKDIDTLYNENLKVNIGGDGYQNIIQPSKMGSSHNQAPISVQKAAYVLTLEHLAGKIDTIRTGNHNYWTTLLEGEDWDREITRKLKLLYMKHWGMVYYKVGDMVYPWLMLHQATFHSNFNLTHTCKQQQRMYYPRARIVTVEHRHVAAIEQYQYDGKECIAIRPGTYHTYDDYAQQMGFFGSHVCNPAIVMYPDRDKLVGFKDMYDGIQYMKSL